MKSARPYETADQTGPYKIATIRIGKKPISTRHIPVVGNPSTRQKTMDNATIIALVVIFKSVLELFLL